MAKIKGNALTEGLTGTVAKQIVFKKRLGTRYACAPPTVNENRKPSARQRAVRDKMKKCNAYSIRAINDPELKMRYQALATGGQTAVNIAVQDAWHGPVIRSVITSAYKGNVGDVILVHATDNFHVASVTIAIFDKEGKLLEDGNAISNDDNTMWTYTAKVATEKYQWLVAKAYDLPANETTMKVSL